MYLIFEGLLVKYCGKDREGNLFCLRAEDAEFLLHTIQKVIEQVSFSTLSGSTIRYASINLAALRKFGSLEFRSLQTPKDLQDIETWIKMLLTIKDRSLEFNQPSDIVEAMSANGLSSFASQILGEYEELLGCPDMENVILGGIRRVQPIVYSFDPKKVKEVEKHWKTAPEYAKRIRNPQNAGIIFDTPQDAGIIFNTTTISSTNIDLAMEAPPLPPEPPRTDQAIDEPEEER